MKITISAELEARLRKHALREGKDPAAVAETLLTEAFEWDEREYADAVAGIRRGLESGTAGRVRPAAEVLGEIRRRSRWINRDHLFRSVEK